MTMCFYFDKATFRFIKTLYQLRTISKLIFYYTFKAKYVRQLQQTCDNMASSVISMC